MLISDFNAASVQEAADLVRPAADVTAWVEGIVAGRPYDAVVDVLAVADDLARDWTAADVEAALSQHPRIGERPEGSGTEARLSRGEQPSDVDDDVARRLVEGNRAYEARFDRIFLIRAAGRTAPEILAQLEQRLQHDEATELAVVTDQLRQIAALRLRRMLDDD